MRLSASFIGAAGEEVGCAGAEALATCARAADGAKSVTPSTAARTQTSLRRGVAAHAISFCLPCIRQTPASGLYFLRVYLGPKATRFWKALTRTRACSGRSALTSVPLNAYVCRASEQGKRSGPRRFKIQKAIGH